MNIELIEQIQGWVDKRFGVPNTFNTQLLVDFLDWAKKELAEEAIGRKVFSLTPSWLKEFEKEAGYDGDLTGV